MSAQPPRFPITAEEVDAVVAAFYVRVRAHPDLGPVFFATLSHDAEVWAAHERKIAAFWRNAILHERSYSGQPMLVHMGNSAIRPEHFAIWLALFRQVTASMLPREVADAFSALADRIGAGLRMGVEQIRARAGVPILT